MWFYGMWCGGRHGKFLCWVSHKRAAVQFELRECLQEKRYKRLNCLREDIGYHYEIYHGVDRRSGDDVAVKIISKPQTVKHKSRKSKVIDTCYKAIRRKLKKEVRILTACKHFNIVRLYGMYESSNTIEVVFELAIGGEVMKRVISPHSHLYEFSEVTVSKVLASVLSAIEFLHSHEIIHGDIRPEHILYANRDPESKVFLVGFGRAGTISNISPNALAERVHEWENKHDIKFCPPSLFLYKNLRNFKEACQIDVWAFGVTMYVLLYACFPFDGNTVDEIKDNIRSGKFTFPCEAEVHVSRAAKDLICRLLSVNPMVSPSIQEIKRHPWLSPTSSAASNIPWNQQFLSRHRSFVKKYIIDENELQTDLLVSQNCTAYKDCSVISTNAASIDPVLLNSGPFGKNIDNFETSADSFMKEADSRITNYTSAIAEAETQSVEQEASSRCDENKLDLSNGKVWHKFIRNNPLFNSFSMLSKKISNRSSDSAEVVEIENNNEDL